MKIETNNGHRRRKIYIEKKTIALQFNSILKEELEDLNNKNTNSQFYIDIKSYENMNDNNKQNFTVVKWTQFKCMNDGRTSL